MEIYESNSNKFREEKQKIEQVVNGKTKIRKKSEFEKFINMFFSEDIGNVKQYIFFEVLAPTIKKAIYDVLTNTIDMILYGEPNKNRSSGTKISYQRIYESNNDNVRRYANSNIYSNGFNYDDIIFANRSDADLVLDTMNDIIDRYGVVSVADFYELSGSQTDNYTLNKYGWKNLSSATVIRTRDGFVIKLPKAITL